MDTIAWEPGVSAITVLWRTALGSGADDKQAQLVRNCRQTTVVGGKQINAVVTGRCQLECVEGSQARLPAESDHELLRCGVNLSLQWHLLNDASPLVFVVAGESLCQVIAGEFPGKGRCQFYVRKRADGGADVLREGSGPPDRSRTPRGMPFAKKLLSR